MSHMSIETWKQRKTLGQRIAGRIGSSDWRSSDLEDSEGAILLLTLIGIAGAFGGPPAAGTIFYDIPAGSHLSLLELASCVPFVFTGVLASSGIGGAYIYGPSALAAFGIKRTDHTFDDLSWIMKRRILKQMAKEDKELGWRPRLNLPHPQGQTDTHDRFRVRMTVDEGSATAELFIQQWTFNNATCLWEQASRLKNRSFQAEEQQLIHDYFEQLHSEADAMEQTAEKELASARTQQITDISSQEIQLAEDIVVKENREQVRKEKVASLLAMSAVLDDQ